MILRRKQQRAPPQIMIPSPTQKITKSSHYYTTSQSFEKSLDIYRPNNDAKNKPIVALVVGSAWLGHRSIIYAGTSWWNSSGPKAVARLGYTCVCIRHRGSFPRSSSPLALSFVGIIVKLGLDRMLIWLYGVSLAWDMRTATLLFLALSIAVLLMELAGTNSASFQDMQNDVMDALVWFDRNRNKIFNTDRASDNATQKIVFGGYSSGGHVASMVMQQPQLWKDRKLPNPTSFCSTVLYISPVLCTKPYHFDLERHLSSLSSTDLSSTSSSSNTASSSVTSTIESMDSTAPLTQKARQSPTWLTNQLIDAIFGQPIPSPIHTYTQTPSIPHLFIGCNKEMFGLNWLDLFFASKDFNALLKSRRVESRFIGVDSDHWNILGSLDLTEVLERELRQVL